MRIGTEFLFYSPLSSPYLRGGEGKAKKSLISLGFGFHPLQEGWCYENK